MNGLRVAPILIVMFFALSVVSVYATGSGYTFGVPILGTTGAPALASPSLFSGVVTVLYADGTSVVLQTNHIPLDLCASTCVTVSATLKQTSPGTYTYTFTPPALNGTVTIYVGAETLADDNGRVFPSVNTQIGTYAFTPSTTASTSAPVDQARSTTPSPAAAPVAQEMRQAVPATQAPVIQTSLIEGLLLVLSALAGVGLFLVLPSRH